MFIYRTLLILLSPLIILHVLWKALQCRQWHYLTQRLGFGFDNIQHNQPWFHCASVGEVKSLLPLLEELHRRLPTQTFFITSNTPTSKAIVQKFNKSWIQHAYCPVDWRNSMRIFLITTKPAQCNLIETELWPNMIELCNHNNIPVTIYNGRLSEKTTNSSRWMLKTYRHILKYVDATFTRSETDLARYTQLGSDSDHTFSIGDLKLAAKPLNSTNKQTDTQSITQTITERDYVLVVSTHKPEELKIAQACQGIMARTLFVIAPRHPERSSIIASELQVLGLNIAVHSKNEPVTEATHIYLLDTIGELDLWYTGSLAVIMGGSFANIGGHNIIEPLSYFKPVLYGPHMQNFIELSDIALSANAAVQLTDYDELANHINKWVADESSRHAFTGNAKQLMTQFENTVPTYADIFISRLTGDVKENKL